LNALLKSLTVLEEPLLLLLLHLRRLSRLLFPLLLVPLKDAVNQSLPLPWLRHSRLLPILVLPEDAVSLCYHLLLLSRSKPLPMLVLLRGALLRLPFQLPSRLLFPPQLRHLLPQTTRLPTAAPLKDVCRLLLRKILLLSCLDARATTAKIAMPVLRRTRMKLLEVLLEAPAKTLERLASRATPQLGKAMQRANKAAPLVRTAVRLAKPLLL
jgi:hypothetical protein